MCSRFELNSNAAELARQFSLPEPPVLANLGEFRPTDRVLVIDPDRSTALRAWGIPAPWDGKPRTKMRIARGDDPDTYLCFAGLGDAEHTTIVTCPAAPVIADVHGRMPVLLESDQIPLWLDTSRSLQDLAGLLQPRAPGGLRATPAEPERQSSASPGQPDLFG